MIILIRVMKLGIGLVQETPTRSRWRSLFGPTRVEWNGTRQRQRARSTLDNENLSLVIFTFFEAKFFN